MTIEDAKGYHPRCGELRTMAAGELPGRLILAVLAALYSQTVISQDAVGGLDEAAPVVLDVMQVTASRDSRSVYDVGTAVTVIDRDELAERPAETVVDYLRGETGVFVQQTTPGQGIPIIRGLKGSEVLYLIDGMRLNNAFFRNAPNQYLALVDAFAIERIEVVRGPSSTLYGSDAMGGVVQMFTPEPHFDSESVESRGRVLARSSSAHTSIATRLEAEAGRSGQALRIGATYQDLGDRRTGDGEVVEPSGYKARAIDAKAVADLTPDQDLMLSVQYLEQPKTPRVDELVPGFGQSEPASDAFFFEPNDRLFWHGRYRNRTAWALSDQAEFHVAWQVINDDRRTRDTGSTETNREQNKSELFGATAQLTRYFEGATLVYGAELYRDRVSSERTRFDAATGETRRVRSRFPDGSTQDSLAIYANLDLDWSGPWSGYIGARYSQFDVDLPATDDSPAVDLNNDDITWNLGVSRRLGEHLTAVANLGRGFRAPNIFDLGTLGPRPGNRFNIANTRLDPEVVTTLDVGLKARGSRFVGEIFAFYSDYQDKISSVATGETTEDGRTIVQSQNLSSVELWGIEAGGELFIDDGLTLYGNANYTWGEEEDDLGATQPADRIPPLNAQLGAIAYLGDAWTLDTFVRFAAEQDRLSLRDIDDPRIDPDGTPGWATANLRVTWQARPELTARLALQNILDHSYREHGSGIDAPGFDAVLTLEAVF